MIKKLKDIIDETERSGVLTRAKEVEGFSGEKVVGLLQRLGKLVSEDDIYLEVGVYQGMTLISMAFANQEVDCYGIDDFSQFDKNGINKQIVITRKNANKLNNIQIIEEDFEKALKSLPDYIGEKKVSVYFVDGPHDYRSQLLCLELIKPHLTDSAIIVVDDANYPHVRQANADFLQFNKEFKLGFQAYTKCHPKNLENGNNIEHRKGWWNGINLIVRDKGDLLENTDILLRDSKDLFVNDNLIHSDKYAESAPNILQAFQAIIRFKFVNFMRLMIVIIKQSRKNKVNRYPSLNVYTDNIVGSHYNPKL